MSAPRPWRQVSRDLFAFSTTDRRDLNVAIMTVFEDAAVLRPSMTFDQIRAGLTSLGWDEPLDDDELDRALAALVGWRLLEATQDHSARYATPEEFERRNLNWSLTQHGIAAIGGLLHAVEMLGRAVSLQPAVLDAIADGLHELHSLATDEAADPARVATRLAEVEGHMTSLVSNVRQFNSHLQRLMREDATTDDVFIDVKERTVTYLQEFVNGVDRPVRRVALNVHRIESIGVATLLDLALTGANLAPLAGEDPSPGWQADRGKRWEALRAWFAPADAAEARIKMLDSVARQAIVQLLRVLERRREARRRSASIPHDFRKLAAWFASGTSEEEAHRLFNAAFGMWPARHAHLSVEDAEAVASTTSWLQAPQVVVAPSLRTSGSLQHRGRPSPVADPAAVRARRQLRQAEELARNFALRSGLHTGGPVRLSWFGQLDRDAFEELLALLGHALSAPIAGDGSRRALSADGQVEIVLQDADDGTSTAIETDDGMLHAPNFIVEIRILDLDVVASRSREAMSDA